MAYRLITLAIMVYMVILIVRWIDTLKELNRTLHQKRFLKDTKIRKHLIRMRRMGLITAGLSILFIIVNIILMVI